MEILREWYSAKELEGLKSLPSLATNITRKAKTEEWIKREREGIKGGGFEYAFSSLPEEVQTEIRKKVANSLVEAKPKTDLSIVREQLNLRELSSKQIEIADARCAVAQYVLSLEIGTKGKRKVIIDQFCDQLKCNELPEQLVATISVANAKQGKNRTLSPRTLYDWVLAFEKAENTEQRLRLLVPTGMGRKVADLSQIAWLHDFLEFYQKTTGLTVTHAYRRFSKAVSYEIPTISTVRRTLNKLPEIVLQRGRLTGSQAKQIMPFVRRDWSQLDLFDCYIGDGHGFKAKIRHPEHSHGFVPEVTALIDGRSRLVVGWSVAKSESVIAVADALRHSIEQYGTPLIYYSDNGGGEKNKTLDADITGVLPRLGITHETGLAGNPQARGIIERLWRSTLIPLAREYETSTAKTVDKSTAHLVHRKIESAVNAIEKGKELTDEQRRFYRKLPRFEDFINDVERVFNEYNNTPHSSLPKKEDGVHFSPIEYKNWILANERPEMRMLTPIENELLFRPEQIRQVRRGEIQLDTNIYFSVELAPHHNEQVRVCYDIHDPSYVIVKKMSGEWICKADLDGNKRAAFPQSVVEKAKQKAIEAANKRLEGKIARNNKELHSVKTVTHNPSFDLLKPLQAKEKQKIFFTPDEKEYYEQKQLKQAIGG
ncbi:DNA-binding protein [Pasteurella skyensis]|uniref:DNA-binding protein n=1 Tax=Phocoenobacter skyensis TaxID=97481 RepID=A0AAJ6NEZ0_9PAST|nr:Mu transposase C-terminal domain-containing protein [Pasteurella skyensis]MDP8171514.1 DNA-binding protein [Pasteurella skyensis]MDP8175416.1 DNA-binding protein [Pasteurella skyensis]